MIVAITDGRANISLKRSTDPQAAAANDAPRPSLQELKVNPERFGILIVASLDLTAHGLNEMMVYAKASLSELSNLI